MAGERANDPRAFREFLDAKLSNGGEGSTLRELFDLWELEDCPEEERRETLEAIQNGLGDMRSGRTRPLEEFDREFRDPRGLPPRR